VIRAQLQPQPDLHRLYVLPSQDSYTVVASAKSDNSRSTTVQVYGALGGDFCPVVKGAIYSLDRRTGQPRWSEPAVVSDLSLPLNQASAAPVLVFFRNKATPASTNMPRANVRASLLVMDKRDGRELYSVDGLSMIRHFGMEADRETQSVTVKTNGHSFRLQFTDQPVAEAQPVRMLEDDGQGAKALRGLSKMADAILQAITDKEQQQQQPAPAAKAGAAPAVKTPPPRDER
jgi:hypothetical protein